MKTFLLLGLVLGLVAGARGALKLDVEYGKAGEESLRLDAFVPDGHGPFPAVILVHGGAWRTGDKSGGPSKALIAPLCEPLAGAGFAWFSINYRLAPKHPYPACIEDVETAIRWVKAHAADYQVDPRRIALAGESAGGHLVALAAVRADESTRVAAVVPFYAPFDLVGRATPGQPLGSVYADLFGQPRADERLVAIMRSASPMFAIKPGLPPFLLVHGTSDNRVPYQQSVTALERLKAAGVSAELLSIKGGQHGMKGWDAHTPEYKAQVVEWLQKTLGGHQPAVPTRPSSP